MYYPKSLAKKAPKSIKEFLRNILYYGALYRIIPHRILFGKTFWKTFIFLYESQWWSKEKIEEYQKQQLQLLIQHACRHVPYYHKMFDELGINPNDICDVKDLKKLPYLDKDTFKLRFNEITARNINRKNLRTSHTSGTSGKPLQFYCSPNELEKEWAFVCHQWLRVGYLPGEPRIELRGPLLQGRDSIVYDPIGNVLRFSPNIPDVETAKRYLKTMASFRAHFLHGYPSVIAYLAHIIRKHGLDIPLKPKAVLFVSEAVYDWEREIVQDVFNCRVFSHYGMAEHVATAAECEHSQYYHFMPQYGIVEIDPGTNEIIATGFLNYVNPFIRYRTTDVVSSLILSKCDYCGRNYFPVVKNIEGRLADLIVTPKEALISPAAVTHPFKDLTTVRETQIIQESIDRLILRVALWDESSKLSKTELERLVKDLQKVLDGDMQIKVEIVDEIEKTKSGKFKWIVSKISKDLIEKGYGTF